MCVCVRFDRLFVSDRFLWLIGLCSNFIFDLTVFFLFNFNNNCGTIVRFIL